MTKFASRLTRATAAALAAAALAGCGTHLAPTASAAKAATRVQAHALKAGGLPGRKPVKALADPANAQRILAIGQALKAHGATLPTTAPQLAEDDAAPAAAAPKVDNVAVFQDLVASFGYGGDRRHMVRAIHDAVYQFVLDEQNANSPYFAPRGWDPAEYARLGAHFCYWFPTFTVPGVANTEDYATQALLIAQSRQDVKFYVWVSKPAESFWPNQQAWLQQQGGCPTGAAPAPTADPNPFAPVQAYAPIYTAAGGFNVVKAVGQNPWMVNVGAKRLPNGQKLGVIQDYFEAPPSMIDPGDLGNLVPIPQELYF